MVVCANPTTVREIMLAAEELNMVDSGEYVFFNIELFARCVCTLVWGGGQCKLQGPIKIQNLPLSFLCCIFTNCYCFK